MSTILDMKEAAAYLHIDYDTLRAYEKRGLIASVRYPSLSRAGKRRKKLFRKETLDAFIEQSEQAGTNPGTPTIVPMTRSYRKGWYQEVTDAALRKA